MPTILRNGVQRDRYKAGRWLALPGNGFVSDEWPDTGAPPPEITLEELDDTVEAGRDLIGQRIDQAACYIDSFFDDEWLEGETAEARLGLGTFYFVEPGKGSGLQAEFNLRVDLPKTEERLHSCVYGEIAPQIRLADRAGADGTPGIEFCLQAVF